MPYQPWDTDRYRPEPAKTSQRSAFARDRARVLHCAALRRLAAKTQVMTAGESDIPRTRLTHTLEVAQVSREIGAALGADPDLVEVAALAHDIGHPPFGHNGEDALNRLSQSCGGFEGNAQSFRVLTRLEAKVQHDGASAGLNLTRAALDAATKYPWPSRPGERKFGVYEDDRPIFDWVRQGRTDARRCFEAQIMDWADDVAYSVHDVEDAVVLRHLHLEALTDGSEQQQVVRTAATLYAPDTDPNLLLEALNRLVSLPFWPSGFDGSHGDLAELKELTSELIGRFCAASQSATVARHGRGPLCRYEADLVVPQDTRAEVAVMKAVAAHYLMFRPGSSAMYQRQEELISRLVGELLRREGRDLDPWLSTFWDAASTDEERLRVVVDQVASLTDMSALRWYDRICR